MKLSRRSAAVAFCSLPLFAALPATAQSADAARIEAQIAEKQRLVAGNFDPAGFQVSIDSLVQRLEIAPPTLDYDAEGTRRKLADGSPADFMAYRVELSGELPFMKAYTVLNEFWSMFQTGVKLEELRLEARPGNVVAYHARYAATFATLAVVPFPKKPTPEHLERRRLTLKLLEELEKETESRGIVDSLGFLSEKLDAVAIGFSRVSLSGGRGAIEGAALGPSAAEALTAALAESGLAAAKADFKNAFGACRTFALSFAPGGQAPEDSYMYFGDNGLFDAGIAALCDAPGAPKKIEVAGKAGAAGFDLDLRAVRGTDAVAILAELGGESLVAAPGAATIWVSVAARGASVKEIAAALAGAGIRVTPGDAEERTPAGSRLADMEFSEGSLRLEDGELAGFGKKDGEGFGVVFFPNRRSFRIATESSWIGDGLVKVGPGTLVVEREDGSQGRLAFEK